MHPQIFIRGGLQKLFNITVKMEFSILFSSVHVNMCCPDGDSEGKILYNASTLERYSLQCTKNISFSGFAKSESGVFSNS